MSFFEQVFGSLTHNNAAPGANNLGALVAVASSGAPTYTAGDQVLLSVDLSGNVRATITNTPAVTQSGVWSVEVNDGTNVVFTSAHPAYVQGTVAAIQSGTWSVDAIQSGSWAVTANAGTNLNTSLLALDSTLTGGTAKVLAYDGTNVIFTSGHPGYVQFATAQAVTISSGSITSTDNITEWNSVALGSPTAYGTPPSGNVIGVNAYVTTLPAITVAAAQTIAVTNAGTFAVQATGTVTAQIVGHSGVVLDAVLGATKPANVLQVGGNDGTNAYALPLASGGASVVVSGSVTATVSGTVTANQGTPGATSSPWPTRAGAPTTAAWSQVAINCSSVGANVIISGITGQTIRVMRMFFVNSDASNASNVTIQDTTPTSFTGPFRVISAGSFNGTDSNGEPMYVSGIGQGIQLNSSVGVQLSGTVWYTQS